MNTKNSPRSGAPKPPTERGKFPARLHVLLARDAKIGLVIRRGPSKSVCTVLWNRQRDTFKLGQWLRGRIYERRSDLSPDGKHFIYFAMNGRWESETKGSWPAISRVPYLKAVSLFKNEAVKPVALQPDRDSGCFGPISSNLLLLRSRWHDHALGRAPVRSGGQRFVGLG